MVNFGTLKRSNNFFFVWLVGVERSTRFVCSTRVERATRVERLTPVERSTGVDHSTRVDRSTRVERSKLDDRSGRNKNIKVCGSVSFVN